MDSILFTPAALLDFLSQIDELKDYDVSVVEQLDGTLQVNIGDSVYALDASEAVDVDVDDEVIEQVEDANEDAYESLTTTDPSVSIYSPDEVVESGIIKELAKSLLLGGMIRLSKKLLN